MFSYIQNSFLKKTVFLKFEYLMIFIWLVVCQHSYSQSANYHPYDFYDNKHGLSQGTVNCIVQDKYGYMWFGTQDGLNKFDGLNFVVYKKK